jgi:hypothetical protein
VWVFAIAYIWLLLLWPYVVSALAAGFWLLVLRRRLEGKAAFAVLAFIACMFTNNVIDYALGYVIPLDVAGTPPPDPRNVHLRFLITAAVQLPAAMAIAYFVARVFLAGASRPTGDMST